MYIGDCFPVVVLPGVGDWCFLWRHIVSMSDQEGGLFRKSKEVQVVVESTNAVLRVGAGNI